MKRALLIALLAAPAFAAPLPEDLTASIENVCFFTSEANRFPSQGNRTLPWVTGGDNPAKALKIRSNPIYSTMFKVPQLPPPDDELSLVIFRYKDGSYAAIYPVPFQAGNGDWHLSWVKLSETTGFTVEAAAFDGKDAAGITPRYVVGKSADSAYAAVQSAVSQAMNLPWLKGSFRPLTEKKDPEMFQYLGWCSWEQYKQNINEWILSDAARALKASPIPIRWMLVDDGFHQQNNFGRLLTVAPKPDAFPTNWKRLMAERSDKLRWFGAWHAYYGYWNGISTDNTLPKNVQDSLFQIHGKHDGKDITWIYPGKTRADAQTYFDHLVGTMKGYGFDFLKIDAQCQYLEKIQGQPQAVSRNVWMTQALEQACRTADIDLMNCMAMGGVMPFFATYSASMRCSIDYQLNNADFARSHLWQSYHNALWLALTLQPDHDMFHSSDPFCGGMMARSKALSRAAVYLSDAPRAIDASLVMPIVAHDGKILRPLHAGVPLPDSIFIDPLNEAKPYRVAAPLPHGAAALCAYNLLAPRKASVTAEIRLRDYADAFAYLAEKPAAPKEVALFDQTAQRGCPMLSEGSVSAFELPAFSDRLFILAPVQNGWAVVGRSDKYLTSNLVAAIKTSGNRLTLTLAESGPLVIWSKEKPRLEGRGPEAVDLGEHFWKFDLPVSDAPGSWTFIR